MPLDPEAAAWLDRQKHEPPRGSLTAGETRAAYLRMSALTADPAPMARVEDVVIAGQLRGREYWPATGQTLNRSLNQAPDSLSGFTEAGSSVAASRRTTPSAVRWRSRPSAVFWRSITASPRSIVFRRPSRIRWRSSGRFPNLPALGWAEIAPVATSPPLRRSCTHARSLLPSNASCLYTR